MNAGIRHSMRLMQRAAGDEPGSEADDEGERERKENNDTEEGLQRIRSALLYLLWSVECFVGFLELSTKAKFSFQHTRHKAKQVQRVGKNFTADFYDEEII